MTDLPDRIEHAAYYYDVNLKRLIAWFIDAVAITFISFLISLLTLRIGFFLRVSGSLWDFSIGSLASRYTLPPWVCG